MQYFGEKSKSSAQLYDISDSIQRSDEPLDYADNIQRSDEPKYDISNSIQRSFNRYEIESDFDEEEYWHSVEQERLKEDYKNIYENLKEEYGANIPNEDHGLIINTTLASLKTLNRKQNLMMKVLRK